MASKSEILNNLREFTSDQIVEAINAGTVTIYELSKSGNLTPLMRRRIEQKLAASPSERVQSPLEVSSTSVDVSTLPNENTENSNLINNNIDTEVDIPEAIDIDIAIPDAPIIAGPTSPASENDKKEPVGTTTSSVPTNKGMFKKAFSFNGRIRRTEYGISFIIYFIWNVTTRVMMEDPNPSMGACIFVLISLIPMLWFLWAQGAKRCHDRGNSGWYQIIPFYFFVLLFGDGDKGTNEYGDNPKE